MRPKTLTLCAFLAAVPAAAAAQPTAVEVRLSNFKFEPNMIQLKAGQDYALTLVNDGHGGHDFTAKEFFAAAAVAPSDRAAIIDGSVEVPGGERRTVHLRAPRAGTYKVKCTHTLHGAFGMKGEIVVR